MIFLDKNVFSMVVNFTTRTLHEENEPSGSVIFSKI